MKRSIAILCVLSLVFGFAFFAGSVEARNPCGGNPCFANPCQMNPCSVKPAVVNKPIRRAPMTDMDEVKALGEKLWSDASLGRSGLSCNSCHPSGGALTMDPFPKYIKMADDILTLDQMINFCMKNPMKARVLKWNSREMTALAHYASTHSNPVKVINPFKTNPCGANPCGVNPFKINPCSANPCSGR